MLFALFINAGPVDWNALQTQLNSFVATLFANNKINPNSVRVGPATAQYPVAAGAFAQYSLTGNYISYLADPASVGVPLDQTSYQIIYEATLIHEFNHLVDNTFTTNYDVFNMTTGIFNSAAATAGLSTLSSVVAIYNNGPFSFSEAASYLKEFNFIKQQTESIITNNYDSTKSLTVNNLLTYLQEAADNYAILATVPQVVNLPLAGSWVGTLGGYCCNVASSTDNAGLTYVSAVSSTQIVETTANGVSAWNASIQIEQDPTNSARTVVTYTSTQGTSTPTSLAVFVNVPFQAGDSSDPGGSTAFVQQVSNLASAKLTNLSKTMASKPSPANVLAAVKKLVAIKAQIDANGGIPPKHILSSTAVPDGTQVSIPQVFPGIPSFTNAEASIYDPSTVSTIDVFVVSLGVEGTSDYIPIMTLPDITTGGL